MSRLVAAPRRIEFVCLRTDPSPQIALHVASQRRSYLWLRSLWLPPTWTLTMLIWRLHGRTHSAPRRPVVVSKLWPRVFLNIGLLENAKYIPTAINRTESIARKFSARWTRQRSEFQNHLK